MIEELLHLDGRYYVSLWIVLQVLAFQHPLPHRSNYLLRIILSGLALLITGRVLLLMQSYVLSVPLVIRLLIGGAAVILTLFCTGARPEQAAYAAIWAMMTQQTLQNASSVLLNWLWEQGWMPHYGAYLLCWMLLSQPVIYCFAARSLFGGEYTVGRRHLTTVTVLFVEFELVQGVPDIKIAPEQSGLGENYQFVLMNSICLLVAMYLVHTLFVKRQAEAKLAAANALRQHQREQYETARRHVALINHRCHELKVQLASLQQARTAGEQQQYLTRLSEAVDIYDSRLVTGNDVLDMFLAEQGLYCREHGIHLHCVADGKLLAFVDAADLYALATGILRQALEQIEILPNAQRELDLTVYCRQGLAIMEAAWMMPDGTEQRGPLCRPERITDILQKYGAELFSGMEHGCAVLRCLIPVHQQALLEN